MIVDDLEVSKVIAICIVGVIWVVAIWCMLSASLDDW